VSTDNWNQPPNPQSPYPGSQPNPPAGYDQSAAAYGQSGPTSDPYQSSGYGSGPAWGAPPPPPGYGADPGQPQPPAYGTPGYGQSQPANYATPGYGQSAYTPPPGYSQSPYPVAPPPPAYNVSPSQGQLANWGSRVLGALIDYLPVSILQGFNTSSFSIDSYGNFYFDSNPFGWVMSLLGLAYLVYNTIYLGGKTGVTFGRRVAKTKLVRGSTGQPIGVGLAIVRHFAHIVDSIICGVGWLFPLWDSKRQTLADKIVDTLVVTDN
jgi:uncharacterized RDD family membrane protein YckC